MRRKIKLLYVFAAAFVIVVTGWLAISRMNRDIAVLDDTAREMRLKKMEVEANRSDMQKELAIKDTGAYIKETARSLYRYLLPGEILFVVENPEALYAEGEMPQTEAEEGAT